MGGLVSRAYIQNMGRAFIFPGDVPNGTRGNPDYPDFADIGFTDCGYEDDVYQLMTIGTPHGGSDLGAVTNLLGSPLLDTESLNQMSNYWTTDDEFLYQLNHQTPASLIGPKPEYRSYWGEKDELVESICLTEDGQAYGGVNPSTLCNGPGLSPSFDTKIVPSGSLLSILKLTLDESVDSYVVDGSETSNGILVNMNHTGLSWLDGVAQISSTGHAMFTEILDFIEAPYVSGAVTCIPKCCGDTCGSDGCGGTCACGFPSMVCNTSTDQCEWPTDDSGETEVVPAGYTVPGCNKAVTPCVVSSNGATIIDDAHGCSETCGYIWKSLDEGYSNGSTHTYTVGCSSEDLDVCQSESEAYAKLYGYVATAHKARIAVAIPDVSNLSRNARYKLWFGGTNEVVWATVDQEASRGDTVELVNDATGSPIFELPAGDIAIRLNDATGEPYVKDQSPKLIWDAIRFTPEVNQGSCSSPPCGDDSAPGTVEPSPTSDNSASCSSSSSGQDGIALLLLILGFGVSLRRYRLYAKG
jgi:hypothetical protein